MKGRKVGSAGAAEGAAVEDQPSASESVRLEDGGEGSSERCDVRKQSRQRGSAGGPAKAAVVERKRSTSARLPEERGEVHQVGGSLRIGVQVDYDRRCRLCAIRSEQKVAQLHAIDGQHARDASTGWRHSARLEGYVAHQRRVPEGVHHLRGQLDAAHTKNASQNESYDSVYFSSLI